MCHWDISHESNAVDSKEMYQKVRLLYSCRLNVFLGWASIQTSLIQNFLCFLALIIHKRQRFTLRTDSNYNMTAIHSRGFAHWTFYSFVGVVAIVVIVAQTPFVYWVLTTIVTIMYYYNIKITDVVLQHYCESADTK